MNCPVCNHPVPPGDQFCRKCGYKLPASPATSTFRAGAIDLSGGTLNIGAPTPPQVQPRCPICGKYNQPTDTFNCRNCGRDFICTVHQDRKTYFCSDCTAANGASPIPGLFQLNYQFVKPYLPLEREALAQVLVSFTSRRDVDYSQVVAIPSHLCLILDVSGSMNTPEKYPLLREAIPHLVSALSDEDYLTVILFSHAADLALSQSIRDLRQTSSQVQRRIDESGIKFGHMTMLAPALNLALNEIEHFRKANPAYVNRLYILTDGDLHDAADCYTYNPRLRSLEAELNSYGFGKDFALETMKRIMEGVPGGTVKPILNTRDVAATFSHIGELAERLLAQDAVFNFTFAEPAIPGDAFRYQPGTQYFGSVDLRSRTFEIKIGNLERDRMYTFLFEGFLPPAASASQPFAQANLRYRHAGAWDQGQVKINANRSRDEWRVSQQDEQALKIFQVLDALRRDDPASQLTALRARLEIYRQEGADREVMKLVERSIMKLERGETLTTDEKQGIMSDDITSVGGVGSEDLRDFATLWVQRGYRKPRIKWLLKAADVWFDDPNKFISSYNRIELKIFDMLLHGKADPFSNLSQAEINEFDRIIDQKRW